MPTKYTRKNGTTVDYSKGKPDYHGHSSGTDTNLTLTLTDPTLIEDLSAVAKAMGLLRSRGASAGEGSISQLVTRIGETTRHYGIAETARRLKRILPK